MRISGAKQMPQLWIFLVKLVRIKQELSNISYKTWADLAYLYNRITLSQKQFNNYDIYFCFLSSSLEYYNKYLKTINKWIWQHITFCKIWTQFGRILLDRVIHLFKFSMQCESNVTFIKYLRLYFGHRLTWLSF